jgi:tRNA A-37 threonylcarbamoyl transferase component Bud32
MNQPSWVGQTLSDRYLIEELLGQGGMSSVYKAVDPNLKRAVAIKMIHPHLTSDSEFVRRFEVEAAAVAQLRHPNIIQVYDFNHDQNVYYMVLEFVPGETLYDRLYRLNKDGRQLSQEEIVDIGASVGKAVAYAHKRGMIHRDVKPANVMLNVQGEAILTDFGITKIVGDTQHTATGAVVGTALYMAPEQIKGEAIDPRVDIYSLGVMLFEMAAGRRPFEADSAMTIMMMHVNDPVPDLRQLNPSTTAEMSDVISKALEKNPDNRYQSGEELASALRNLSEVEPVQDHTKVAGAVAATVVQAEQATDSILDTAEQPAIPAAAVSGAASTPTTIDEPQESVAEHHATSMAAVGAGASSTPTTVDEPQGASMAVAGPTSEGKKGIPKFVFALGGIAAVFLLLIIAGGVLAGASMLGDGGDETPTEAIELALDSTADADQAALALAETPSPTLPNPPPTATVEPSPTPTASITPTETVPPGFYVRINGIGIEGDRYVVDYETFEYTETLPGMHVHFFFDTVPPEQAGVPGSGPWILYGGPRPFMEYRLNQRPPAASSMCALVANPNHSVIAESGNCVELPEG